MLRRKAFGHQADGMLCAGSQWTAGAGFAAGQMIKDHRLTDVGAANNSHNQKRLFAQLRNKFLPQQLKPFATSQRIRLQNS